MAEWFFDGWPGIARTALIAVMAYTVLVAFLRISGKRTLSKLNAFDLVVTVALGSTLASILLNADVALVEGAVAFAMLIGLQYLVTWSSVRLPWVRRVVTGEPRILLYQGRVLPSAIKAARVTEDEVRSAVRSAGLPDLTHAAAVVLETDGSLSVVTAERPVTTIDLTVEERVPPWQAD